MTRTTAVVLLATLTLAVGGEGGAEERSVELLIVNAHLVTMDAEARVIEDGTLAIDGSTIVAVGGAELAERYAAAETIDAGGDIVMPGMINTHTHASMTIFRGLGDDIPNRLKRYIFPLEAMVVNADNVYKGAMLGAVEMVLGGATTFVDMYYFEDAVARAAKAVGVRAVLGETIIGFPAPDAEEAYGGPPSIVSALRSLGRRDTYMLVFGASCIAGLPEVAFTLGVVNSAVYFAIAVIHLVVRKGRF